MLVWEDDLRSPQSSLPTASPAFDRDGRTASPSLRDVQSAPVLTQAALPNNALSMLSAGDGSESAFLRIRTGSFQTGTVAEPLNLHGWQLVDEHVHGALFLALGENRYLGGTNAKGYILGVQYAVAHNAWLAARYLSAREVYGPPLSIDVLQLELDAKF